MDPHNVELTKKEPFDVVEEYPSDCDSEREDLPLFEARHTQQSTLERALAYSQVLIEKGKPTLSITGGMIMMLILRI